MGAPNQKYSISAQSSADWCALCKCFVQASQKRSHERSQKHKDAIERKMKDNANKTALEAQMRTDRWAITNERECKENIKEKL